MALCTPCCCDTDPFVFHSMCTPLVSVIIPVFNVRPYLNEALDSVLNQTYENLEIIVIDDGSTDGSGMICDEYAQRDGRVSVIHQPNQGLSAARNAGLDIMTGEALVFLDPDDAYLPDYVSTMLQTMIKEKADLVICRAALYRAKKKLHDKGMKKPGASIKQGAYDRIEMLNALADEKIGPAVWHKLYSRKLWEKIRFPVGHVYEDIDTAFRIFDICGSAFFLDQVLYLHRKRPGSITSIKTWKNIYDAYLADFHFNTYIKANIPQIFTSEKLEKNNKKLLNTMFNAYIRFSEKTDSGDKAIHEDLRIRIIDFAKEIGMENLDLCAKTAYKLICFKPRTLKFLYPFYYPFHMIQKKLAGK